MALSQSSGIFGLRDLKISKLLTDTAGNAPTYGTSVDIPGVTSLGMDKKTKHLESRGDEMLLDTEDILESIDISWENEMVPMAACVIIDNANFNNSGTGNAEINTIMETGLSSGNYFKISALAKRGNNGVTDVMVDIYKVKGTLTYSFKGEDYAKCSFKGTAIPIVGTINTYANPIRQLTFSAGTQTLA